jgi:hypothetical protein
MTTTSPDTVLIPAPDAPRASGRVRFGVAFLIGLLVSMTLGIGALYAYDRQYAGRIPSRPPPRCAKSTASSVRGR